MLAWGRTRVKVSSRRPILRWAFWLPPVVWMAGIFYLSHQSAPLGQTANRLESAAAHAVLYGVLAALLYWALAGGIVAQARCPGWVLVAVVFALTVLYGVTDEVHQAFVPGRSASELDLAVDALGAGFGIAGAMIVSRGARLLGTRFSRTD